MASRPFKAAAERDGATDTSSEQDLGSLRELEVDDVIEAIGGFGSFQLRIYLLLGYSTLCNGALNLQQVVVERRATCWLKNAEVECNTQCGLDGTFEGTFAHGGSVAAEFELVCARTIYRGWLGSLFFVGFGFGSLFAGSMAGRVGRKKTMQAFTVLMLIGSLSCVAPSLEVYFLFRIIAGFAAGGNIVVGFVLMLEFTGKAHRGWVGGLGMNGLWALGGALVALEAGWVHTLWNPAGGAPAGVGPADGSGPADGWETEWRAVAAFPVMLLGICLICCSAAIPESPRWLVAQGRPEEAMAILARGAKENGRQLPLGVLRAEGATEQDEETGKDQPPDAEGPDEMVPPGIPSPRMVRSALARRHRGSTALADAEDVEDEGARLNQPRLRYPAKASESLFSSSRVLGVPLWRITLLNLVCWFTASFSYYGLALNSGNLHGSVYLNAAVNSLIDVPALFLAIPLFDKLGRARTLTVTLLIGALACCTFCLLPAPCEVAGGETCEGVADWGAIRTGTAFTGKFMLAIVFGCVFLYTTEVFPTSMRAEGMGLCSVAARVGGVAAPLVVLLDAYSKELPMWIFGGVAFVAGVVSAWLPETLGKELASGIGG